MEHEFVGFGQGVVGVGEKFGGAAPGAPKKGLGDAEGGDHLPPAPPRGVFLGWGGAKLGEKTEKKVKKVIKGRGKGIGGGFYLGERLEGEKSA